MTDKLRNSLHNNQEHVIILDEKLKDNSDSVLDTQSITSEKYSKHDSVLSSVKNQKDVSFES